MTPFQCQVLIIGKPPKSKVINFLDDKLVWAFSLYDINNDGVISKSETGIHIRYVIYQNRSILQAVRGSLIRNAYHSESNINCYSSKVSIHHHIRDSRTQGRPRVKIVNCLAEVGTSDPEKVVDEIFVRMDLDGNGTLSKSEFIIGGKLSILSPVCRLSPGPGHPEVGLPDSRDRQIESLKAKRDAAVVAALSLYDQPAVM